jgi:hypothetical protein
VAKGARGRDHPSRTTTTILFQAPAQIIKFLLQNTFSLKKKGKVRPLERIISTIAKGIPRYEGEILQE